MSSVLEQSRYGERLTDDVWITGDVGTTAAISGDAKSLENKGLRRGRFREVYVAGAIGASMASEAVDPRFSAIPPNYLSAPFVEYDPGTPGIAGTTASRWEALRDSLTGSQSTTMYSPDGEPVLECNSSPRRWLIDALSALGELTNLPEDWDSYGAARVGKSSVVAVIHLLLSVMRDDTPLPSFVPTNRGNILMEWHTRGVDLEVEALGNGNFHVFFEDLCHGNEWEGDIRSDLTKLVKSIRRLSATS